MSSPIPSRPRPAPTAVVAITVAVALTACSTGDDRGDRAEPARTTSTTAATTSAIAGTPPNACDSKMPGEVMTAEEAVIRFSSQQVCPGYVTVALGTPVTWRNTGDAVYTVTIKAGPLPSSTAIRQERVDPGATVVVELPTAGQFAWTTDALEAFVGTIEVQG
ncbi:MAG: hypothetical protein WHS89_02050 [Acidimicrobiales bacterium]